MRCPKLLVPVGAVPAAPRARNFLRPKNINNPSSYSTSAKPGFTCRKNKPPPMKKAAA
jgi:hypothetical protein